MKYLFVLMIFLVSVNLYCQDYTAGLQAGYSSEYRWSAGLFGKYKAFGVSLNIAKMYDTKIPATTGEIPQYYYTHVEWVSHTSILFALTFDYYLKTASWLDIVGSLGFSYQGNTVIAEEYVEDYKKIYHYLAKDEKMILHPSYGIGIMTYPFSPFALGLGYKVPSGLTVSLGYNF